MLLHPGAFVFRRRDRAVSGVAIGVVVAAAVAIGVVAIGVAAGAVVVSA
ncbi:MAG: hypothetical protein QM635_03725 [Microbacteriaceae bacterium]